MVARRFWVLPVSALLVAGCSDEGPVAPGGVVPDGPSELLSCQFEVESGDLSCTSIGPSTGSAQGAIIGGQGTYVELASRNVSYDSGSEVFRADVTVKNLSNQVLGSSDGATQDSDGVRIFFVDPPVATGGSGTVAVANADGEASFNKTGQAYFEYTQAIAPGRTSLPRAWEWDVPATVTSFSFTVGVSAALADEASMSPGLHFNARTISSDSLHNCVLDYAGQAWCWGDGGRGRLGTGDTDNQPLPVAVEQGDLRFASITTGLSHTCAITDTGDAYCWGNGASGRMGNGTSVNTNPLPGLVSGGHEFIQIDGGRQFTCALTSAGDAYCWGYNGNGQLGDGTNEARDEPVAVTGGHKFVSISAGGFHTCGITTGGEAYCWGSQTWGKLGNSETEGSAYEPVLVQGGHEFSSIVAGNHHVCALTTAGEAYCWGSQANGKIGNGETAGSTAVTEITRVMTDERFVFINATYNHSCGITSEGVGYCWGSNGRGKLGIGMSGTQAVPTRVADVENFVTISSGADHGCGVTTTGEVYCWGNAGDGRLGNGSSDNTNAPVRVMGLGSIASIHGAPATCDPAGADSSCFPRRSLAEEIRLAGAVVVPVNHFMS